MIRLISPDGRRERLRWTDRSQHSRYGLGVVMRAKSSLPMDGSVFASMARDGWRIECSTDLECRRVAGALALAATYFPAGSIVVREP
jgi:hypothetical protein